MLRVMRAHGWDRDLNKKNNKKFNFINMGFNLRPLEVSAAIASNQLKRLNKFKIQRHKNREKIIQNLKRHRRWDNQYHFVKTEKKLKPSWFGLPLLLTKKYLSRKKIIIENLNKKGIETRPIISGNFLNQKASKLYKFSASSEKFPNANYVEKAGFFIGLHTIPLDKKKLNLLTEELLRYKID